jgi:hypothetical protein
MSAPAESLHALPGFLRNRRTKRENSWSSEELLRLRVLAEEGAALDVIAANLRRSHSAIRNKAGMHGISLRNCR